MKIITVTVVTPSICSCGYELLDMPAGTKYEARPDIFLVNISLTCGQCKKKTDGLRCILVYRPGGGPPGFMPERLFERIQ